MCTGWAQTSDLKIMNQVFYHCATAPLYVRLNDILFCSLLGFSGVSVVTGSRIFRLFLVLTCWDFPAVSAVTGSRISGRICSYLLGFSGVTFSGTRRPGFSSRICCFWPGFSRRRFSGMGNLKKLYGQQANCSGTYSGIFCP